MSKQTGFLAVVLALSAMIVPIVAAPPQITKITPLALEPGNTSQLTFQGQNLKAPRGLWTTFAARAEFVDPADDSSQKGEKVVCRITVPRGEQVGIGAIRMITGEGVSNPMLVVLDDLPSMAEASNNHTIAQAQLVEPPVAIDGHCDSIQEDKFRFHAEAGQHFSFEVVSQRLGSKLDPVLRLLKADGTQLAKSDDADAAGGDSRFSYKFASAGDYLLALSDVRHLGGNEYGYRLRVGAFPLITGVYPLGGQSGSVMSFELAGERGNPLSKLHVALPDTRGERRIAFFGVPSAGNSGSGWFQVEASPKSECFEQEPNDSSSNATPASLPGVFNGRLDKAGDRDYFKFKARKGEHVHFVAKTRELGSSCDVDLSLLKIDGSKLAQSRQERQTTLDADIPDDGEYVVQVADLFVGGVTSPNRAYRIDAGHTFPGFALHSQELQYSGPHAGTVVAKVVAERRGYNGPIELAVDGLGEGVVLAGNTMGGTETLLKITLPADIPAGEMRLVKIVGKAKIGDQTVVVPASQHETLRRLFPNAFAMPSELEDTIAIGVGPPFPPFFDMSVAGSKVYFPQLVGASSFDINIKRSSDAFKDAVSVVVEGLPKEVAAKVEPVGDGLKAIRVSLTGPANLEERTIPLRISGTGVFQDQSHKVVLDNVTLRVTKPLIVSAKMLGPVRAGGQQLAEVKIERFGSEPQPVRLQVADGPAGMAAPIFVTVPANANQVKIPFTAAADATPGKFGNLVVVATTVVKGQNVTVHSKPASVEIQPASAK